MHRAARGRRRSYAGPLNLPPAPDTVGIVEMGGASLQVTYQAQEQVPASFAMPVALLRHRKCSLFTHSFNGWGREAAMRKVVHGDASPCLNVGYKWDTGAALTCLALHL